MKKRKGYMSEALKGRRSLEAGGGSHLGNLKTADELLHVRRRA